MKVFYTFGTNERFPFQGGWVEVEADNMEQAHALFRALYPDRAPGTLNCAGYYTEDHFRFTKMSVDGNFGAFCHRTITVSGPRTDAQTETDAADDETEALS